MCETRPRPCTPLGPINLSSLDTQKKPTNELIIETDGPS